MLKTLIEINTAAIVPKDVFLIKKSMCSSSEVATLLATGIKTKEIHRVFEFNQLQWNLTQEKNKSRKK